MSDTDLEKRVAQLEHRVEQLMQLVDSDMAPFTYHMLEADATEAQVKRVYDLMDEYWNAIKAGTEKRSHNAFEQRVYEIFPNKHGNYHFAEGIVRTLRREDRYREVYDYMLQSGMNLHPMD